MSLEDDTENGEVELRELVTQTLEENGVLAKIKAQLRAGLYLALENDINTGNGDYNDFLKTKLNNPDVRIIFSLVREFLEYFELNFTCSVFEKESFMGTSYEYKNREKLIQELDIGIDALHNSPLLLEILNVARSSFNLSVRDIKFNSTENNNKNTTYDILDKSADNSNSTETVPHVINIKTVPKDNLNETKERENIAQSVADEKPTEHSEVIISENVKNKQHEMDNDDTYEGTSSIAEDSVVSVSNREQTALIDFDKSIKIPLNNSSPIAPTKHIIDQTIDDNKSPRLSGSDHSLSASGEKRKQDKSLKPMSALSSLSDLPPLQLNKSRNSDTVLLPSLYSKREKSGIKDFDKLFDTSYDSLDNYEEDFLSSTSLEDANLNIFIPAQISNKLIKIDNKTEDRPTQTNKIIDNNTMKSENVSKEINKTNSENGNHNNEGSNTTTISEDFDINSNFDDLLKSEST